MKELFIYIGPEPKFSSEHEALTKIQIDNSFELGWEPEDILLVTDFDWEYRGIKSHVLKGDYRALDGNRSTKILVINQLFKDGLIGDDLYWFHDHDAFQLGPMRDPDLGPKDAAFCNMGWSKQWDAGSFFFKKSAEDIFQKIYEKMIERGTNEQSALTYLWENNIITDDRYKLLNITYDMGIYHVYSNFMHADKPLLVAHFHPHKSRHLKLFMDFIPERLVKIFADHGIK